MAAKIYSLAFLLFVLAFCADAGNIAGSDATSFVFDHANLDLQLIDDKECKSGKALELRFHGQNVVKGPLPVMNTSPAGPLQPGFYRATARLKMQGLLNSLGTGIILEVCSYDMQAKKKGPAFVSRIYYLNEFTAEDAWQDFSLDFDIAPPLLLRTRCNEQNVDPFILGLGVKLSVQSRAALRAWLLANPAQLLPEDKVPAGLDAALVKAVNGVGAPPSHIVLAISIPQNVPRASRGNSTPFPSLRRLFVDTLVLEKLPEPSAVVVRDLQAQNAWLRPGEKQTFYVDLHNRSGSPQKGELKLTIESGLDTRLNLPSVPFDIPDNGYATVPISWNIPLQHRLWGQSAIVEAVVGGKTVSSWRTWFTVHPRNTAVMIPYGKSYAELEGHRFQHRTASKPNVSNLNEYWAPTPYDSAGLLPENPDEPFLVGNSGKVESLPLQKKTVGGLNEHGIATAFYLEGHGTGLKAWEIYWDHPDWCSTSEPTSDLFILKRKEVEPIAKRVFLQSSARQKQTEGEPLTPAEQAALKEPEPERMPAIPHPGFVTLNGLSKPVIDNIISGTIGLMDRVPYTTCRWDNARPLACFSTNALGQNMGKTSEELRRLELENLSRYLKEVRAIHPGFEVGFNHGHGELMGRREDPFDFEAAKKIIDADPLAKAILADGGYILEEAWGHSFEVWNDYKIVARNYLRACRAESAAYKYAGGQHGHMFRDNNVQYAPDDIYQQLFSLLGGAHLCLVNYGPLPESEYDLGVYAARFSEFFWDPKLRQLTRIEEKVSVESESELWSTEAGFEKDTEAGTRLYVLPLINPPVTESWLKNRYGQLPEPVRKPIAVTVKVPEGFKGVKAVYDLNNSPWPEVKPLKFETDGTEVRFEFPELVTFKVAVVEFTK